MFSVTARKRKKNQHVEKKELHNVHHHPTERDLKWTQVRVDGKNVHQFQGTNKNLINWGLKKKIYK